DGDDEPFDDDNDDDTDDEDPEEEPFEEDEEEHPVPADSPVGSQDQDESLIPSTSRRADILEADMPPWKKACLTAPTPEFKIRESSVAGAARQDRSNHRHTAMLMDREAMYSLKA
nr:hypothetical protein [Tanacetum cinerariifolium]